MEGQSHTRNTWCPACAYGGQIPDSDGVKGSKIDKLQVSQNEPHENMSKLALRS